jgi:hypothetical protein
MARKVVSPAIISWRILVLCGELELAFEQLAH